MRTQQRSLKRILNHFRPYPDFSKKPSYRWTFTTVLKERFERFVMHGNRSEVRMKKLTTVLAVGFLALSANGRGRVQM